MELSQICLKRHRNPSGVQPRDSHHDFLLLSHPTGFPPPARITEAFREPSPATVPIALRSPGFWGPRVTPKLRVGRVVHHLLGGGTFPEAFPLFSTFLLLHPGPGAFAVNKITSPAVPLPSRRPALPSPAPCSVSTRFKDKKKNKKKTDQTRNTPSTRAQYSYVEVFVKGSNKWRV